MPHYITSKDRLTLLFGGNVSGNTKLKPHLVYCSENPRTPKSVARGSGLHRLLSGIAFPPLYLGGREILLEGRITHSTYFAAQQCSETHPIHGQPSSQHQNNASATKYYIVHLTYGPGGYVK